MVFARRSSWRTHKEVPSSFLSSSTVMDQPPVMAAVLRVPIASVCGSLNFANSAVDNPSEESATTVTCRACSAVFSPPHCVGESGASRLFFLIADCFGERDDPADRVGEVGDDEGCPAGKSSPKNISRVEF
jgi:hypothetical protein